MDVTKINGCEIRTFSRVSKRCRLCSYKDYCDHKRLQAEAAIKTTGQSIEIELGDAALALSELAYSFGISAEEFNKAHKVANGKENIK